MTDTTRPTLSVHSPADLIAAVPYLLGFHPADSLVVVALRGTAVAFAARYDLPGNAEPPPDAGPLPDAGPPPDPGPPRAVEADEARAVDAEPSAAAVARQVARVVCRQGVEAAIILGYGPAMPVTAGVQALATALRAEHITVLDELRVTAGRFWSYRCREAACCPPEGTACHPAGSVVAAAATFAGQVALPDRAALVTRLAPVEGAARTAMRAATTIAERRRHALISSGGPADPVGRRALRRAGDAAVREAVRRHRAGGALADEEVAWLGVVLTHLPVRDRAWSLTDAQDWYVSLWTELVRRVEPAYVPAPGCLLAFAAWCAGQGALASVALDRVRRQDPGYPMGILLDEVLQHGLPPSALSRSPGGSTRLARPGRPVRRAPQARRRDLRS